jgi:yeast amino acid transporter
VPRENVNPGVWITILLVLIIIINYFGIKIFGEFEFWLSSIKVCVILGLIILCFVIALGGAPTHDRYRFTLLVTD